MLDKLLAIGASFDWISPSWAFVGDLLHGPPADFGLMVTPWFGRPEIKRTLGREGIKVWGILMNFEGDIFMLTVPRNQARRAYHALANAGAPIVYYPAGADR